MSEPTRKEIRAWEREEAIRQAAQALARRLQDLELFIEEQRSIIDACTSDMGAPIERGYTHPLVSAGRQYARRIIALPDDQQLTDLLEKCYKAAYLVKECEETP